MISFKEEDVVRIQALIKQATESMAALGEEFIAEIRSVNRANAELNESQRILTARLRHIQSGGSMEEIAGIPALLHQVERTRRQLEHEKLLRELPRYSEFYKRPIGFNDRFVREYEKFQVTDHRVIERQMRICFNLNPFHPSLNTQTVRQPNIPNTNPGDSISRASDGIRFTWRATENHIEILWIMPRENLP